MEHDDFSTGNPDEVPDRGPTHSSTAFHIEPTTQPQPTSKRKNSAIRALIAGVLAFLLGFLPVVGALLGILAIVLGFRALLRRASRARAMAVTGIIFGAIATLVSGALTVGAAAELGNASLVDPLADVPHSSAAVTAGTSTVSRGSSVSPSPSAIASEMSEPTSAARNDESPAGGGEVVSAAGVVLPNSARTPGAINASVTQSNIDETICTHGWTATIRPPSSLTTSLKIKQLASGYAYQGDLRTKDYEEDHLISLELGGSPEEETNLWPEPYGGADGARVKDQIENKLNSLVCTRVILLAEAQSAIASNWWSAYQKYVVGVDVGVINTPPAPVAAPPAPVPATPVSGIPAGATALCKDGTYSFSSKHSGSCSRHGGVTQFY